MRHGARRSPVGHGLLRSNFTSLAGHRPASGRPHSSRLARLAHSLLPSHSRARLERFKRPAMSRVTNRTYGVSATPPETGCSALGGLAMLAPSNNEWERFSP